MDGSCVFHVAGKYYVTPAFEGMGTERLYKIDYGPSTQGVFTVFVLYGMFYWHYSTFRMPSAFKVAIHLGTSVITWVMLLQTAVGCGVALCTVPLPPRAPRPRRRPCRAPWLTRAERPG